MQSVRRGLINKRKLTCALQDRSEGPARVDRHLVQQLRRVAWWPHIVIFLLLLLLCWSHTSVRQATRKSTKVHTSHTLRKHAQRPSVRRTCCVGSECFSCCCCTYRATRVDWQLCHTCARTCLHATPQSRGNYPYSVIYNTTNNKKSYAMAHRLSGIYNIFNTLKI